VIDATEGGHSPVTVELPIDPLLPEIVRTVADRSVLVLQAPPGAGKTTRVPPALLDQTDGEIIVLEPRRLAARLSAKRVAEERSVKLGELIGYDVRFDRAIGPKTRLSYVTEGILTRRLLDDPELRGVSCVVLDEFHERHLQSDLALGLLKRLRGKLSIVVMSATLDAGPVAAFLDAPVITSEGRTFPVTVEHLPRPDDRPLQSQVASAVRELVKQGLDGDVLVFLPGAAEIRKCAEACAAIGVTITQLHGDLPPAQQDAAIARSDRPKVILSTNVAETSVTIEGVVAVIDSGLARIAAHDPWSGRTTLEVMKISRASATQRAGRAGRVRPGRAIRLYTKGDFDTRREHDAPEIARVDLSEAILGMARARLDPRTFDWLTPPPPGSLDGATALLRRLGAIDNDGITSIGKRMLRFPLAPRLARMIVEAEQRGATDDACVAAAILSHGRDIYARGSSPGGTTECDLSVRIMDLRDHYGVDRGAAAQIERIRAQLARIADRSRAAEDQDVAFRQAVLAGFPDRVAKRRLSSDGRLGASRELLLATGGHASLAESSVVRTAPFVVAVEAMDRNGATVVWLATAIEPDWLFDLDVRETVDVSWNAKAERVEAVERIMYDKLVIDERPAGANANADIAKLLVERALARGIGAFVEGDAFDDLRLRIEFARQQDTTIHSLDDDGLRALLVTTCEGSRSFDDLRAAGLLDAIRGSIGHAVLTRVDELAPSHVTLGNGRRVKVEYVAGQAPAISSRLQDFFGSTDTPRVGRVPLVLHLLAPNGRDVQVTTDLAGFWDKHYPTIRKELMRRYPRHAWPEDPKTAAPPEIRHPSRKR
jgi:ATP-dependent helicase HrpB